MTYEQEAIWLDDHLSGGSSRYLESWVYRLSGQLDLDAVGWAISRVVDRHEALRSRLTDDGDSLVQIVLPSQDVPVPVRQRPCDMDGLEDELRVIVSEPLDLNDSPLRVTVLELAPDQSVLVVQFHHAVVDDWALDLFGQEFGELYTARVERRPAALAPPTMQLGEYALGQRAAAVDATVLGYWRERLRGAPDQNAVPPDRPRPTAPGHASGQVRFRVGDDAGQLVRQVGRLQRTTPFTVLTAATTALLCGYNGTSEVILGASVSRRGDASLDGMMGCLTGVLPLRQAVRPDQSFADLITSVRSTVLGAFAHRDIPYTLVARAAGRRYRQTAPLCQTVIVVDDAPRMRLELPGLTAERLYVPSGTSKFDLCLTLVIDGAGYLGFLDYAIELYDPQTARRIAQDFQALLVASVSDPARSPVTR
jgi:hypothetical protein